MSLMVVEMMGTGGWWVLEVDLPQAGFLGGQAEAGILLS